MTRICLFLFFALCAAACHATSLAQQNSSEDQQRLMQEFSTASVVLSGKELVGSWESSGRDLQNGAEVQSSQIHFGAQGSGSFSSSHKDGLSTGSPMSYRILTGSRLAFFVVPNPDIQELEKDAEEVRIRDNRLIFKSKSGYQGYTRVGW